MKVRDTSWRISPWFFADTWSHSNSTLQHVHWPVYLNNEWTWRKPPSAASAGSVRLPRVTSHWLVGGRCDSASTSGSCYPISAPCGKLLSHRVPTERPTCCAHLPLVQRTPTLAPVYKRAPPSSSIIRSPTLALLALCSRLSSFSYHVFAYQCYHIIMTSINSCRFTLNLEELQNCRNKLTAARGRFFHSKLHKLKKVKIFFNRLLLLTFHSQ